MGELGRSSLLAPHSPYATTAHALHFGRHTGVTCCASKANQSETNETHWQTCSHAAQSSSARRSLPRIVSAARKAHRSYGTRHVHRRRERRIWNRCCDRAAPRGERRPAVGRLTQCRLHVAG